MDWGSLAKEVAIAVISVIVGWFSRHNNIDITGRLIPPKDETK